MAYLADTFGRLGSGRALDSLCQKGGGHDTLTAGTRLTRIRNTPTSHMRTQNLLSKNQGEGEREGVALQDAPPEPRISCSKPQNPERNHGLTNARSFFCKPNQGPTVPAQLTLHSNPPVAVLAHLLSPRSTSAAWQGCAHTTRSERDLSLGTVM